MKTVIFAAIGAVVISILPMQSGDESEVIRIRSITPGEICPPTERAKAILETDVAVGASIVKKNYWVQSLEDEDVVCDMVRFSLKNKGSVAILFSVPENHQEAPFLHVEGLVDDKWTSSFPIHAADGSIRYISPVNYRYPSKIMTVGPGETFYFPVHIERWRFSVASSLRISLRVWTDASKDGEFVNSNGISVKP